MKFFVPSFRQSVCVMGLTSAVMISSVGGPGILAQSKPQTPPGTVAKAPVTPVESVDKAAVLAATEEIFKAVSKLRGLEIKKDVKAGFRNREELEKDVLKDMDESTPASEFDAQAKLLGKLGLVPAKYKLREEMIKILSEQIGGYYKPRTGEFFLTDRTDLEEQKIVIAHELTHALQDQHFDLRRFENFPKGMGDKESAIHALIEGEATVVMFDYLLEPLGGSVAKLPISITDMLQVMSGPGMDSQEKTQMLSKAPRCIRESLTFPYFTGAGFVQALVKDGGWASVSKAYTTLPESTEQIMHPEKYLKGESATRITLAAAESVLGKDWKVVTGDVTGEFGYTLILSEYLDEADGSRGADGWDGDACRLYENAKTGQLLLVQHTSWDSADEAKEFYDAYAERTRKRYTGSKFVETKQGFQGETKEGWVTVQIKGSEVLVLEGSTTAKDASTVSAWFWKEDTCEKAKKQG